MPLQQRASQATPVVVTSRDPLNAATRSAYGYVYDNPLNASDPSGLCNQGGASGAIYGFFSGDNEPCPAPTPAPLAALRI